MATSLVRGLLFPGGRPCAGADSPAFPSSAAACEEWQPVPNRAPGQAYLEVWSLDGYPPPLLGFAWDPKSQGRVLL